jgi:hypothetical protein
MRRGGAGSSVGAWLCHRTDLEERGPRGRRRLARLDSAEGVDFGLRAFDQPNHQPDGPLPFNKPLGQAGDLPGVLALVRRDRRLALPGRLLCTGIVKGWRRGEMPPGSQL